MTSSGHAYLQRSALCSMPWSRVVWTSYERFYGRGCCPCTDCTGQGMTMNWFQQ